MANNLVLKGAKKAADKGVEKEKQRQEKQKTRRRVIGAALVGAGVIGTGAAIGAAAARRKSRMAGDAARFANAKFAGSNAPRASVPGRPQMPHAKTSATMRTGARTTGNIDVDIIPPSKKPWKPMSADEFRKRRASGQPIEVGSRIHPVTLRSALKAIMLADPSGDPRPRNRMGQFADQSVNEDPIQQNKAAYAPGRKRRIAAVVAGGVAGTGIAAGVIAARARMKKMRPIPQPQF